jgi:hypothetical protein
MDLEPIFPSKQASQFEYFAEDALQTITVSVGSEGITVQFKVLPANGTLEVYCRNAKGVRENGTVLQEGADFQYNAHLAKRTVPFAGATTISIMGAESLFGQ